jgi:hypothetical protein
MLAKVTAQGDQGRGGSAPGALTYTAVQAAAVGAHRAAILLNGRP